jgi:hypothetical protein
MEFARMYHQKQNITRAIIVLFLISLFSLLTWGQRKPTAKNLIMPAQSTTGPIPPQGIDLAGHRLRRKEIQTEKVIPGVPSYLWRHGSGPTAVGMVLGYYDSHGFPNLIPGNASYQSDTVNLAIASGEHYNDYSLPLDYPPNLLPDKSELPVGDEHPNNCIADYLKTSQSILENYYGGTWNIDVAPGFENYVQSVSNYKALATAYNSSDLMWFTIQNEIDSLRPLVFLVDTDGNGQADHFVTVIGYYSENGINYYGCYNTWDQKIHWYEQRRMEAGKAWGIATIHTFVITYAVFPPSNFKLQRLENNYIFFKEYINRLTWRPNPKNMTKIIRYKLSRKLKGAASGSYQLLAEVDGSVSSYDDRGLAKDVLYTYKITAVDEFGRESSPVAVSN